MPKPEQPGSQGQGKAGNPPGQDEVHEVTNPDGTTVEMTQREWKNRDKGLGQTRPDDDETETPVAPA